MTNITREAIITAADMMANNLLGVPVDLRPMAMAAWAAMYTTNANAPTLYQFDKNGHMIPTPGRVISPEEQAWFDQYNKNYDDITRNRNQAFDDFIRDTFPDTWHNNGWPYNIDAECNRHYGEGITPPVRDPLAIDLDGDGVETNGLAPSAPILFDHNGDGVKTGTGWLRSDDAWLVHDKNGNGTIDSGRELFGVDTEINVDGITRTARSGFEALSKLDQNGDLVFDAEDELFLEVKIWRDLNQDGVSQLNELSGLVQGGIQSISLESDGSFVNLGNGNSITGSATVILSGGSETNMGGVAISDRAAGNLNLSHNPFYSEFADQISHSQLASQLPEMRGSGMVRNLRDAMSLGTAQSAELATKMEAFASLETMGEQRAALEDLVIAWGNTSSFSTSIKGLRRPSMILMGHPYEEPEPGESSIEVFATQNPELFAKINALEQFNAQHALSLWEVEHRAWWNYQDAHGVWRSQVWITGYSIQPPPGALNSMNEAWTQLQESIYGALVSQTRLSTYIDSIQIVLDERGLTFDSSSLLMALESKKAIDPENALIDLIELNRYMSMPIEAVNFDGISVLRQWIQEIAPDSPLQDVLTEMRVFQGPETALSKEADIYLGSAGEDSIAATAGNDLLDGDRGDDRLFGGIGNDVIKGGTGSDYLDGGAGADYIQGGAQGDNLIGGEGDDTLDGGAGEDWLSGGAGSDTYIFGKNSGQDRIYEQSSDSAGGSLDILRFESGISAADVTLKRVEEDLHIGIKGADAVAVISNYFHSASWQNGVVENIKFADGTVWNEAFVRSEVLKATNENDFIYGYDAAETLLGGAGNDTVHGWSGDDVLRGESGNDSLTGFHGDDVLEGGAGSDSLYGGEGADILEGGAHNDYLYGNGGNDTLDGGAGNDTVDGGNGANVYKFGRGGGHDAINNSDTNQDVSSADRLVFGPGISASDLSLSKSYTSLRIALKNSNDIIDLNSYFYTSEYYSYRIESIEFTDGIVWTYADVKSKILNSTTGDDSIHGFEDAESISGGDGNDTLMGWGGHDVIDGGNGKDLLDGGAGNDVLLGRLGRDELNGGEGDDELTGNEGADTLYGKSGADVLDGGVGDDYLYGGDGADVYKFGRGYGDDRINEYDGTVGGGVDTVLFGAGIVASDLVLTQEYNDLVIQIKNAGDRLLISSYFYMNGQSSYAVENLKFAAGNVLNFAAVQSLLTVPVEISGQAIEGNASNNNLLGAGGADTLVGHEGNDTLDGGAGNDTLSGGSGNDTFKFGRGSGQDVINSDDGATSKVDVIELGAGVSQSDVRLSRDGDNLVLAIAGASDTLMVSGYFLGDVSWGNRVEQIKFSDATIWTIATVKSKVLQASSDDDTITGYATSDSLSGLLGDDRLYGAAGNDSLDGGDGEDSLYGQDGDDHLKGGRGRDNLEGGAGQDHLLGQDGVDYLFGGAGNDTLEGGADNDFMDGGAGSDLYRFGRGSGKDEISNNDATVGRLDIVELGAGIATSDVSLSRSGAALLLTINGSNDSLRIRDYFSGDALTGYQVDRIKFVDGTIWSVPIVKSKVLASTTDNDAISGYATADSLAGSLGDDTISGQGGNDTLLGEDGHDSIMGGDGNDELRGGDQNDTLSGGEGGDILFGGQGNDELNGGNDSDTLDGGVGSDQLSAGAGNDVYRFGRGSGKDRLYNSDSDYESLDIVELGAGVSAQDVLLRRVEDDLVLTIVGSGDILSIVSHFSRWTSDYQIDQIKFIDGTVWEKEEFKAAVLMSTMDSDKLLGYASDDVINGDDGADTLYGSAGNDILDGGAGHDSLTGDDGDDVLSGGSGDDVLIGGVGSDQLIGGGGADKLWGGGGNDTLNGGAGADTMSGEGGQDEYIVDHIDDVIYEQGSDHDFVYSSVTYALSAELEDLTLKGATHIDGTGNALNNQITGSDGNNRLIGGAGDDIIDGGQGSDMLEGGLGNDNLFGGVYDGASGEFIDIEADTLQGGEADDLYWITDTADTIIENANEGTDLVVLVGTSEPHSVTLADHVEHFQVNVEGVMHEGMANLYTGHVDVTGNAQANRLWGTGGTNFMDGGTGNDTVSGAGGNDDLIGGTGNDVLDGGSGNDTLYGGIYDWSTGEFADVEVDTLRGGSGDDVYWISNLNDTIIESAGAGGGTDVVVLEGESNYHHVILANNVEHFQTNSEDSMSDNMANLYTGNLDVTGNGADNRIWGTAGVNVLMGDGGNDLMYGANGDDYLEGGQGNDRLAGGNGSDALAGGYWNHLGYLASGLDTLMGGAGDDYYYIGDGSETVTETTSGGNDTLVLMGSSPISLTLAANVENAQVGQDVDVPTEAFANQFYAAHSLTGNGLNNRLWGSAGVNQLNGGAGNDSLHGAAGNDVLVGGTGNDLLDGGSGNDTFYQAGAFGVDVVRDTSGALDVIQFGDASYHKLWLTRSGQNLELSVVGTADKVIVENWFSSTNKVEQMIASGHVLQSSKVSALVQAMAGFSPQDLAQASSTLQAARDQAWAVIAA